MKNLASKYLSFVPYDFLKAALITFLYALIDGVIVYFNNNKTLPDVEQFKSIAIHSAIALIAYLKVKFATNSEGKLFQPEQQTVKNQ
jgi:hypothetical protein